ncbi:hypothetical protein BOX15_Mlig017268g3 [Macrostomum lignano]|uniref:Tubulin polyglutamylase TTLL4 n=1 Tax=Macrostomum lignano TaxID=282301 RepID=A0A267FJA0_9PLAT|nr:hypothetical protein BOX15_Mlig017268g3 [Macrostomum lignano]
MQQQQQQQLRHLGRPRVSTSLPITSLGLESQPNQPAGQLPVPLPPTPPAAARYFSVIGGPRSEFRASLLQQQQRQQRSLRHQAGGGRYQNGTAYSNHYQLAAAAAAAAAIAATSANSSANGKPHHHHHQRRRSSKSRSHTASGGRKHHHHQQHQQHQYRPRFPVSSMAVQDDADRSPSSPSLSQTMPAQQQAQPELPHDETEARLLLIRAKLNQLSVQQELAEQAEAERQRRQRQQPRNPATSKTTVRDRLVPSLRPPAKLQQRQQQQRLEAAPPQSGSRKAEEATSDVDSNVEDDEDNDGDEECDDDDEEIDDGIDDNGDDDGSLLNGLEDDLEEDDNSTMSTDTGGGSSLLASRRPSAAAGAAAVAGPRQPAVIASLFPNVPPVLRFSAESNLPPEPLPWAQRRQLKWRMSSITPVVVKRAIARSGFRVAKKSHEWLGYFGKHMKPEGFKGVREYQKVNHFPGSFTIGRKDRLWRCLHRMQCQYGRREFDFFPLTFCLPGDLKQLRRAWDDAGAKQKWIVKPPASARGIGIRVVNKWKQVPKRRAVVVQTYLARPYLINGSKFDLRVYVYVTSFDPLRVYVHERGLVRFASVPYSRSGKTIGNRFMHLTNYSVNKRNINYSASGGEAEESDGEGHKWSLRALWAHLRQAGKDPEAVWSSIKDLVVKTIIGGESHINSQVKAFCRRRYCVHELFGFDILLDDRLKPWLLEVNISPSLHSNSPLDIEVKSAVIRDFMNLAGFQLPEPASAMSTAPGSASASAMSKMADSTSEAAPYADRRCWPERPLNSDERAKKLWFSQRPDDRSILDTLTPDDVRVLVESMDEFARAGEFGRVFPAGEEAVTRRYLSFMEQPRYYNLLLMHHLSRYRACESQGIDALAAMCRRKLHLESPTADPAHQWSAPCGRRH